VLVAWAEVSAEVDVEDKRGIADFLIAGSFEKEYQSTERAK
jgi:hypothetical protein